MSDYTARLEKLATESSEKFVDDVKVLIKEKDISRLKELVEEVALVEVEILTSADDIAVLLREIRDTKLGTMAHVLDTERIVATREIANMLVMAAKTMLTGFSVVAKELIKVSIRTAAGGVAGAFLGSAGEAIVDRALDAAEAAGDKLVDKGADAVSDALDDVADNV